MKKNKLELEIDLKTIFSKKIKSLRQMNDLSQNELAKIVGIHQIHLGRYERAESLPSIDTLKKLADIFKVSTDYLLSDIKNENPEFKISDPELVKKLRQIEQMDKTDIQILNSIIELIVAKKQIKSIVNS